MKWLTNLGAAGVLLAIGAAVAWAVKPAAAPIVQRVIVTDTVVRELERVDTVVTWRERVVYRTLPPVQVRTAPGGAEDDVARFCPEPPADTATPPPAPQLLLRSVRTEAGWFFGRDRVIATGPLSTGDLQQLEYLARPGWQVHVHGDTAVFQSPRFGVVKPAVELGVAGVIGFLLGAVFH